MTTNNIVPATRLQTDLTSDNPVLPSKDDVWCFRNLSGDDGDGSAGGGGGGI